MGTVHRLLEQHGKAGALAADVDRRVVEAAAGYMGDEDGGVGFIYSGWTQAALPHKRLAPDAVWQISSERVRLLVEPGRRAVDSGEPEWVGVPYGSRARLILLFLQSEALRTNSREIDRPQPAGVAGATQHPDRREELQGRPRAGRAALPLPPDLPHPDRRPRRLGEPEHR